MKFTDANGREWALRVDTAAIRRARAGGVDLSNPEKHLEALFTDHLTLCDCLWSCVAKTAQDAGISQEEFESRIRGEVIESARDALLAAVIDFFHGQRKELLEATIQATRKELHDAVGAAIAELSTLGNGSTASPAS
jgi:hypothetical protein